MEDRRKKIRNYSLLSFIIGFITKFTAFENDCELPYIVNLILSLMIILGILFFIAALTYVEKKDNVQMSDTDIEKDYTDEIRKAHMYKRLAALPLYMVLFRSFISYFNGFSFGPGRPSYGFQAVLDTIFIYGILGSPIFIIAAILYISGIKMLKTIKKNQEAIQEKKDEIEEGQNS